MWPSDAIISKQKPAFESYKYELPSNSASDGAQEEIDISSETAENSDQAMCVSDDSKTNSPELLLGTKFLNDKVYNGKPEVCGGVLETENLEKSFYLAL